MTPFADILLLSAAFVVMNGVFVAAEFALIATPRATLEHRAQRGERFAKRVLAILESPRLQDRYVATAQLGITVASLGLGMFGEHAFADLIEPSLGEIPYVSAAALATGLSLALLTLIHIVFGEMVPKGVALQRPDLVWRLTNWPMRLVLVTLYPLVSLSSGIARVVLRLIGVRRPEHGADQSYTPEELALIVEESQEGGVLRADSGRILRELFEFGDLTAREAMVPRVEVAGLPVGATPEAIRAVLAKRRHTRYPVYDGDLDHIVGMIHVKDLLRRLLTGERITAADARRLPLVPETATLDRVLAEMQRASAHLAVVIDEYGGTAGIVSLEDLFEEVVGELDEGQPVAPKLAPEPDGSVRLAGTVRLDEVGQHFDLDLSHEDVDSVSGLVLARLDRPPVVGDVVEYDRIRFEVTATHGHGVREVRARLLPEAGPDGPA
ncbi:MAG: hemolysin family protein [Vicinamibacterales bacterium]